MTAVEESSIRREQGLLWGGGGVFAFITFAGAIILVSGGHWYYTLLMIPVSAIGALMTFASINRTGNRELLDRLPERDDVARAERASQLDAIIERLDVIDKRQSDVRELMWHFLQRLDGVACELKEVGACVMPPRPTRPRRRRRAKPIVQPELTDDGSPAVPDRSVYMADMAEAVRLGRELERRKADPPGNS